MFKVYWTEVFEPGGTAEPFTEVCAAEFGQKQLTEMLAFCEMLRRDRREGRKVSFITSVGEDSDSVGEAGVGETGPEYRYQWYKRREPPPGETNG